MKACLRIPRSLVLKRSYHQIGYAAFTRVVTDHVNKNQVYISQSLDPYLNLSIEHYLLKRSPPESIILFLYINQPSIIIGRNQNPWNEIHMALLREKPQDVKVVRRRSGGGTVFHDAGNVNYCVINPTHSFNRDRHAEMVVQALKQLGVPKVRVNERHDIVIDRIEPNETSEKPYKVSGSAYKLTRSRSLHHGTCLLSSPHLKIISQYLDAPAKTLIKARGVASVSSQIMNVGISNLDFQAAVIHQFCSMYSTVKPLLVDNDLEKIPEIADGLAELKSSDWIYCQTPQFTCTIDGTSKCPTDPGKTITEVCKLPKSFHEEFTARNGCVTSASASLSHLLNKKIHEITDWKPNFQLDEFNPKNKGLEKLWTLLNILFATCNKS
ncbi:putative lipoate-protein ligase A [Golovinomyces cichoracearum]|uniref:Putative lipoate-protein ligase A n=1 Tax=Golovinomyces cichoracearum TaxID=62708 RepID=A0A420IZY2_9PEZI|nr:putative lipoate-protein ligase A [Golovinomyces cichoracearum]